MEFVIHTNRQAREQNAILGGVLNCSRVLPMPLFRTVLSCIHNLPVQGRCAMEHSGPTMMHVQALGPDSSRSRDEIGANFLQE